MSQSLFSKFKSSDKTGIPESVKFIHTISVDYYGRGMGKLFPREKWEDICKNEDEIVCLLPWLGPKFEIAKYDKSIMDGSFKNVRIIVDQASLFISPWVEDGSLASVFVYTQNKENDEINIGETREIAKIKLNELKQEFGLEFLMGVENEFRLFQKNPLNEKGEKPNVPIEYLSFMEYFETTKFIKFFNNLKDYLDKLDIHMDSANFEYGNTQIEIPLKPERGIKSLDKQWIFKEAVKNTAHKMDLQACFMTVPISNEIANGLHTNFSLWDINNNVFHCSETGKLSTLGQHFLAGIMEHTPGLLAFTNPTVNCYRRMHKASFAPNKINWNYCDRLVSYCVKTNIKNNKANFIENRTVTSCSNIYLVVTGILIAGMDGIRRKLKLIEPQTEDPSIKCPISLKESLEALKNDQVLVDGFGKAFIDNYINIKTFSEVDPLKDNDLTKENEADMIKERILYLKL